MKLTIELDRYSISYYILQTIKGIGCIIGLAGIMFLFGTPVMDTIYVDNKPFPKNWGLVQIGYGALTLSAMLGMYLSFELLKWFINTLRQNALVHKKRSEAVTKKSEYNPMKNEVSAFRRNR